jgi:hypothetical protein
MTEEQIFELAQEHLELLAFEGTEDGDVEYPTDFAATSEQLLKFARAMYDKGREDESELYVDENY